MKRKLGIQDFAEIIEQREGISRTEAENFVRAFFDVVEQGLEEDKFVKIKGLGTFKLIAVSERESVNINTGERFQISGHTKISFTPDAAMKELINRPFAHFEAVDLNDSTDTREFEEIDEEMEADSLDTEDNDENNEVDGEKESASENEDAGEAIDAEVEAPPLSSIDVQTNSEQEKAGKADNLQSTIDNELDGNKQQSSTISSAAENATEEAKTTNVVSQVEKQEQKDFDAKDNAVSQVESATQQVPLSANSSETTSSKHNSSTSDSSSTQGYVYGEVPSPRKRNWWKIIAILFGIAILMTLSYFVGYYRMLCPNCGDIDMIETSDKASIQPVTPIIKDSLVQQDTIQCDTANTVKLTEKSMQETQDAEKNLETDTKENKSDVQVSEQRNAVPQTHVVAVGDNVYRIARRYYGSDKYAERIIKYNNIKDANTIVVGMELKLPRP